MTGSILGPLALCGALMGLGVVALVWGLRPPPVRLGRALAALEGEPSEAAGARTGWRARVPLWPGEARLLELKGTTAAEHAGQKVLFAALGAAVPGIIGFTAWAALGVGVVVPALAVVVGAVVGFLLPDLLLLRGREGTVADAGEALFTYFDLVTLERLGNASATQALTAAASMSEVPLFVRIRTTLDRARLEQRPPYADLKRLADELALPELADIADVMRLDEHGASLAGTLRARVKELRDAHLNREKVAAHEVNERMTVWMVLPAMVFALIFLLPPLLRMVAP